MARIPMGDFGQLVPQAQRTPTASAAQLDGGRAEATQRLAQVGMNIATERLTEQARAEKQAADKLAADAEREREKQAARAERVSQLTAHANIQTGLADLSDEIGSRLAAGELGKDDARKQLAERSQKVIADQLGALPPDIAPLVNAEMLGLVGRLSNSLEDSIRKRDQQDADAGLLAYKEKMQRFASTDMATAVKQWESVARQSGAQAGWDAKRIEQEVQGFREGVAYTKAFSAVSDARDMNGLQKAEALLGQLPDIDPQRRATLENTITVRRMGLQQQAEMAAQRQARAAEAGMRRAEATAQSVQMMADKGTRIDPAYAAKAIQDTAGTPYQAAVVAMVKQANENGGLAAQPIAAQQAALDAIKAQIARDGRSPALDKRREQLEKVLSGARGDIEKEGGLRAGLDRGVIDQIAPLDLSTGVAGMAQGLAVRVQQADMVGKSWAGVAVPPLLPEEITVLAGTLGRLASGARSAFIADLEKIIPPKQMTAIAKQINDKDRALALAIGIGPRKTPEGNYTRTMIFDGAQALKDKTATIDPEPKTGTRAVAAKYLGDALQGKDREDVLDAAEFIDANFQAKGKSNIKRAVRLALHGDVIERGKQKIPVPAGLDEDKFDDALEAAARRAVGTGPVYIGAKPMPGAQFLQALPQTTLEPVGHGRYLIRDTRGALITTDGKKPLILGVN